MRNLNPKKHRNYAKCVGVNRSVIGSWRQGTRKQYGLAWKKWYIWNIIQCRNPICASETVVIQYLNYLVKQKKSYSVVNTHKAMLLQTINLFDNEWCANPKFISRFMKGLFNKLLPKPRYSGFIRDVSVVLKYLSTLFPLDKLSLKLLTLKVTALIALSAAPRAQTIISMN